MRLLLSTAAFLPRIGGLEIYAAQLAGLVDGAGHEVAVVTETEQGGEPDRFPFQVLRRPGPAALLRRVRWCDVFFQANVSLRGLWPLLLIRRPWVVSHHSWYCRSDGRIAWQDRLKRRLLRHATASIAVSRALAEDLGTPAVVIGNAYRDEIFRLLPGVERRRDLVFVGRLVSDKGVDVLLDALARLAESPGDRRPGLTRLTIVGDGPEAPRLRAQAERLGLAAQVDFVGTRTDEELVALLNQHQILVVPSRYREPFGIVALEGIACGCVVVGSAGGGLAEAIGPCGPTFPNGDAEALATVLAELLGDEAKRNGYRTQAPAHLARHTGAEIARRYLEVLASALAAGSPRPAARAEAGRR